MRYDINKDQEKLFGIYKIENLNNGKIYIGSTSSSFKKRYKEHLSLLFMNDHHSKYLQRSFNKHGINSFVFSIVEIVDTKSEVIKREQYYLDYFKCFLKENGYNVLPKAYSSLGFKHSEESKKLIGKSSKERGVSKNARIACKLKNTGRKREIAHLERMSKIHSRKVVQLDLQGNFIKVWNSMTEATLSFTDNSRNTNISACTRGRIKSCFGFMWIKYEDYDSKNNYEYNPIINGAK